MYIMCPQILVKAAQDEEKRQVGSHFNQWPLHYVILHSLSTCWSPTAVPEPRHGSWKGGVSGSSLRPHTEVNVPSGHIPSENLLDSEQWKLFHKDRKRKDFLQYTYIYIRVFVHRLVQSILMLHHSLHMYTVNTPGEYFEPFYLELEFTGKEIEVCTQTVYVGNYLSFSIILCSVSVAYSASIHPTLRTHSKIQRWRNTGPWHYCTTFTCVH